MVKDDTLLYIQWCGCMWLLSLKTEAHMCLHVGHGMPVARMGAEAALCLQSHAVVRHTPLQSWYLPF